MAEQTSKEKVLAEFPEACRVKNVTGNEAGPIRSAPTGDAIILGHDWDIAAQNLAHATDRIEGSPREVVAEAAARISAAKDNEIARLNGLLEEANELTRSYEAQIKALTDEKEPAEAESNVEEGTQA